MTALATASPAASWAPPRRVDKNAAIDRVIRLAAALLLWLGLLLVTYWWIVDGGVADLGQWASGLTSVGRLTGLWAADLLLIQGTKMLRSRYTKRRKNTAVDSSHAGTGPRLGRSH